jgi:4-azaleucine resistance transporter AzlC
MVLHGLVTENAGFLIFHDAVKLLWFDFSKSVSVLETDYLIHPETATDNLNRQTRVVTVSGYSKEWIMERIMEARQGETMQVFIHAFRQTAPIVMGYIPVGFAYGVLAQKVGLSPLNTVLMSVMVFAGSAQLIAVGLMAAGVPPLSVIMTTFVVNLRHLLMSASLSPYLKTWKKWQLALFSFELTDETFALHATRYAEGEQLKSETFLINVIAQSAWVTGTVLGMVASTLISDVKPIGLDYALPAMFIALLVAQVKERMHVLVALVAGGLSVGLALVGVDRFNVILATIIAATIGLGVERWIRK